MYSLLKEFWVNSYKTDQVAFWNELFSVILTIIGSCVLTFTPLKDLEIFKTLARMTPAQLKSQISTSQFSIDLISRNNPELVNLLGEKKNSGETLKNLCQLFDKQSQDELEPINSPMSDE